MFRYRSDLLSYHRRYYISLGIPGPSFERDMVRMAVLFGVEPRRLCRQSAPATVILQSWCYLAFSPCLSGVAVLAISQRAVGAMSFPACLLLSLTPSNIDNLGRNQGCR